MHSVDHAACALAATQAGRFTREQITFGQTNARSLIRTRLASGRWLRLTSRVLALPGAPTDPRSRLWTAVLHFGPDVVLSHTSAALLRRFPAIDDQALLTPEVTVARGSHRRAEGFRVHQRDLDPADVTVVDGLPTTSVARTLVDLAPNHLRPRVEMWLDHLVAERLVAPRQVAEALDRQRTRGRAGLRPLADMVDDRMPGPGVEQGLLERRLTGVLRRAGLGTGAAQFPHPGRHTGGALVDRAYPAARLVIEADGRKFHDRRRASSADKRRDRAAAAVGWLTVRYEYVDLVHAAEASGRELREIHDQRIALVAAAQRDPGRSPTNAVVPRVK